MHKRLLYQHHVDAEEADSKTEVFRRKSFLENRAATAFDLYSEREKQAIFTFSAQIHVYIEQNLIASQIISRVSITKKKHSQGLQRVLMTNNLRKAYKRCVSPVCASAALAPLEFTEVDHKKIS